MYYYFLELGRSGNTGHLLELLLPNMTSSLVYGDLAAEQALVDRIVAEYKSGCIETVIMYPSSDAVLLSDFLANSSSSSSSSSFVSSSTAASPSGDIVVSTRTLRLVALDGTYNTARRQCQWLRDTLEKVGVPLPVVKLDLSERGCCSAYLGLMQQPSAEKICTFQAVALALGQLETDSSSLVQALLGFLQQWIRHLVTKKIKLGKEKVRVPAGLEVAPGLGAGTPSPHQQHQEEHDGGPELFQFIRKSVEARLQKQQQRKAHAEKLRAAAAAGIDSERVRDLTERREQLRTRGDFEQADKLRAEIEALGARVVDLALVGGSGQKKG
jgi:DTW domain-containing protein YfiP